jgi:hypothetical protein
MLFAGILGALAVAVTVAPPRVPAQTGGRAQPALTATATPPATNPITIDKVEPGAAARGESVTVSGKFPDVDKIVVELRRTERAQSAGAAAAGADKEEAQVIRPEPVTVSVPQSSFTFVVPFGIPLGRYQVSVSFSQKGTTTGPFTAPVSRDGMLHVVTKDPIKIEAVYPAVTYPVNDRFSFKVRGDGFSLLPEDNALVIEGLNRDVLPACAGPEPEADCVNVTVSDNGRELLFSNVPPKDFKGPLQVQVRVGEIYSEKKGITLARVEKKWPAGIAFLLVLALASLIFLILRRRRRAVTGGRYPGILSAIFLDTETNTYSLSKFQFYAWTAAAIFGYIYLTVSKSWVQGDFTFTDIPGNLPGIIFISASTTVIAVGITSSKGSKGAGELNPSLADFFSSGGVIAAERLQFFVWTLIGVCAFLFLTLSIEPATVRALPTVPENFLYLMGISSFGYLGGKLARKPGPVISKIEAETGSLVLTIHGSNLSPDATFRIDDTDVPPNLLLNTEHPAGRPQVVTSDEQPGFAKVLRMVINAAQPAQQAWMTGTHTFTIMNPDGQKAAWNFTPAPAQTAPPSQEQSQPGQKPEQEQHELDQPEQEQPGQEQPGQEQSRGEKPSEQQPEPPAQTPAETPEGNVESTPQTAGGPTITNVSPVSGGAGGGTPVIISGTNFSPSASVSFGDAQAVTVTVLSPTALLAQSPPHSAGAVALVVTNPDGGSATSASGFMYAEEAGGGTESVEGLGG